MRTDAFSHILPDSYRHAVSKVTSHDLSGVWASTPMLSDVGARLDIMQEAGIDRQVLTLVGPPIEQLASGRTAKELVETANNAIASIVREHPARFIGVGAVCLTDPETAAEELRRCVVDLGLAGAQIFSNVAGRPLDDPSLEDFYNTVEHLDIPLWLHPYRSQNLPDYPTETESRYRLWLSFGWPMDTTLAIARLVLGGVTVRHPNLNIVVHHAGALIPSLANRIQTIYRGEMIPKSAISPEVREPIIDHFRRFYIDTVVTAGGAAYLERAVRFFGAERTLFGTDFPLGLHSGREFIDYAVEAVQGIPISTQQRTLIWNGNLERLLTGA